MPESKIVAPGVSRTDYWWCYFLTGTRADLVASRFVQDAWLIEPGLKDKRGRTRRTKKQIVAGYLIEANSPAHGPCEVRFLRADGEVAQNIARREHITEPVPDPTFERFMKRLTTNIDKSLRKEAKSLYCRFTLDDDEVAPLTLHKIRRPPPPTAHA